MMVMKEIIAKDPVLLTLNPSGIDQLEYSVKP